MVHGSVALVQGVLQSGSVAYRDRVHSAVNLCIGNVENRALSPADPEKKQAQETGVSVLLLIGRGCDGKYICCLTV